eukprot:g78050.t1
MNFKAHLRSELFAGTNCTLLLKSQGKSGKREFTCCACGVVLKKSYARLRWIGGCFCWVPWPLSFRSWGKSKQVEKAAAACLRCRKGNVAPKGPGGNRSERSRSVYQPSQTEILTCGVAGGSGWSGATMDLSTCPFKDFSCTVRLPQEEMHSHVFAAAELHASLAGTKGQAFVAEIKHLQQALAQAEGRAEQERKKQQQLRRQVERLQQELEQARQETAFAQAQSHEIKELLASLMPPVSAESLRDAQHQRELAALRARLQTAEETIQRQQEEIKRQQQAPLGAGGLRLWQLCHPQLTAQPQHNAGALSSSFSFFPHPAGNKMFGVPAAAPFKTPLPGDVPASSGLLPSLKWPLRPSISGKSPGDPDTPTQPDNPGSELPPVTPQLLQHAERLLESYLALVQLEEFDRSRGRLPDDESCGLKSELLERLKNQPDTKEWLERHEAIARQSEDWMKLQTRRGGEADAAQRRPTQESDRESFLETSLKIPVLNLVSNAIQNQIYYSSMPTIDDIQTEGRTKKQ